MNPQETDTKEEMEEEEEAEDARQRKIEQLFDGELPRDEEASVRRLLAEDPRAARYWNQLLRLNQLARTRQHASQTPTRALTPERIAAAAQAACGRPQSRVPRGLAVAMFLAAAMFLIMFVLDNRRRHTDPNAVASPTPSHPSTRTNTKGSLVPTTRHARTMSPSLDLDSDLELELIRLTNAPTTTLQNTRTARAVLMRNSAGLGSRTRSRSQEIFAMELANGSPHAVAALPRPGVTPSGVRRPATSSAPNAKHSPVRRT